MILLTGSTGFIGQHFLSKSSYSGITRTVSLQNTNINDINFLRVDTVVHMAGIAHRMSDPVSPIYNEVNFKQTSALAKAAKDAGVKHFVFLSTIKVYGVEDTTHGAIDENSFCNPNDDYGKSKWEAEKALDVLKSKDFMVTIIRPPLVYGAGVKGNLERMMNLASSAYPLPFLKIHNPRTMVYVGNLIALIDIVIAKPVSTTLVASDQDPISTTRLIFEIRKELHGKSNLFSLPYLFRFLLKIARPSLYSRLFLPFEIKTKIAEDSLGFQAPFRVEYGIREMVSEFVKRKI
jgi:nucleoside-diphosphate-sugar epimerase